VFAAWHESVTLPHIHATSQTPSNHRYFVGFFQKLQSTESCSTDATPPGFLNLALFTLTILPCASACGMVLNGCLLTEYSCFIEGNCRQCLTAVLGAAADGAQGTKAAALRSPACIATNPSLLTDLADNCAGATFPVCTFYKQTCASTPACASCLAKLGTGDGTGATKQCPGMRQEGSDMDNVVSKCMSGTPAACSFWQQRCADNDNCSTCMAGIDGGDNARTIALGWTTPSCQMVLGDDSNAARYTQNIAMGCPGITACRSAVSECVHGYGDECIACVNGSAPPSEAAFCSQLLEAYVVPLPFVNSSVVVNISSPIYLLAFFFSFFFACANVTCARAMRAFRV
jgi:hypothetical protein